MMTKNKSQKKAAVSEWLVLFKHSEEGKAASLYINEALAKCQEALGDAAPTLAQFRGLAASLGIKFCQGKGGNKAPVLAGLFHRMDAVENGVMALSENAENLERVLSQRITSLEILVDTLSAKIKKLEDVQISSSLRWSTPIGQTAE